MVPRPKAPHVPFSASSEELHGPSSHGLCTNGCREQIWYARFHQSLADSLAWLIAAAARCSNRQERQSLCLALPRQPCETPPFPVLCATSSLPVFRTLPLRTAAQSLGASGPRESAATHDLPADPLDEKRGHGLAFPMTQLADLVCPCSAHFGTFRHKF